MPPLLGTKEIESYVRVSWRTIRRWIEYHGFPAKKIDGIWIAETEAIEGWFKDVVKGKFLKISENNKQILENSCQILENSETS